MGPPPLPIPTFPRKFADVDWGSRKINRNKICAECWPGAAFGPYWLPTERLRYETTLYFLLCAIACTSMISATMPMAAIAEAIQPQATAEQQAQSDATSSDTGKAEDGTRTNATADTTEDGAAATDTATTAPTPSLRTQTNGSSQAKARMDVPTYWDGGSQESVCDPSRPAWASYYSLGTAGHDFTFDFTASGTYRIYFYFMDNDRNDPKTTRGSTTCAPRRR